jgi:hypothetical protein
MKRRPIIAVVLLVLFGFAKIHFESHLETMRRAAYFNGATLNLTLRQQVGQMSFLAAVGGFRALVADYCYLEAYTQWTRVEWGRVKLNFDAATSLQPRFLLFWDQAAWHMAFNASIAAYNDKTQPREALRRKAQREYWKLGEDYLLRGIANNPDKPLLYNSLGFLYREKFQDHCKAAEAYLQCAAVPDAPVYARRFAAYEMAQCPGREREAYERLKALYLEGPDEHQPTLLKWLRNLQEKLEIPQEQKIAIPAAPNP